MSSRTVLLLALALTLIAVSPASAVGPVGPDHHVWLDCHYDDPALGYSAEVLGGIPVGYTGVCVSHAPGQINAPKGVGCGWIDPATGQLRLGDSNTAPAETKLTCRSLGSDAPSVCGYRTDTMPAGVEITAESPPPGIEQICRPWPETPAERRSNPLVCAYLIEPHYAPLLAHGVPPGRNGSCRHLARIPRQTGPLLCTYRGGSIVAPRAPSLSAGGRSCSQPDMPGATTIPLGPPTVCAWVSERTGRVALGDLPPGARGPCWTTRDLRRWGSQ